MARPRTPLISRDAAVRTALAIIDEEGLEALNLPAVAKRIGVSAPSLYHHFRDKDEVLAEVARAVLLEADEPRRAPAADWRDYVIGLCIETRRAILRHPHAAPLLLTHPPRHIALRGYERSLRRMEKQDVPRSLGISILSSLDSLVFGSALLAASAKAHGMATFPVFDPASFPSLTEAIRTNPYDDDQIFVLSIRAFLDGLILPGVAGG